MRSKREVEEEVAKRRSRKRRWYLVILISSVRLRLVNFT
jgi:hypothetical protein